MIPTIRCRSIAAEAVLGAGWQHRIYLSWLKRGRWTKECTLSPDEQQRCDAMAWKIAKRIAKRVPRCRSLL
jgi:hypothetical protein